MKPIRIIIPIIFIISIISCVPGSGDNTYNDGPSNIEVGSDFKDNMVLQQGIDIPVWGNAYKTSKIEVELNGIVVNTVADKDSNWKAVLPSQETGGPYVLKIKAKDTTIVYKGIYVGLVSK